MGIGIGIFLIAVGLILALAVPNATDVVDLAMIGWICVGVGVLGLIIGLILNAQRSNTSHREVVERYDDRTPPRSEEHTSELQSRGHLVCRLLLEKKKKHMTA